MNTQLRIDRARWWALTEQPFYGSLAMSLTDVIEPSVPTAATDGKTIKWNAEFVESLTDEEIRFILLHETLHCAHQHLWRLPLDARGNIAGDHEINLTLADIDGISMPEGGLCDEQYRGLACEEILARLPDPGDDDSGGDDGGSDDGDDESSSAGAGDDSGQSQSGQSASDPCGTFTAPAADVVAGDGDTPESMRDDWETRVMQAAQAAQALGRGDTPGDMQRILDRIRHQSIDWRREMADFVKDAMSTRNDWSRAARRHAWQPVIYPRRMIDSFGTVLFARDTSGSIDNKTCAEYSAMISDCVSEMGIRGIVIDCDSRIQAEYEITDHEPCPLTAKGGGGTDFRPVFDRADELAAQGEQIAGIVYLTDLYGPAPQSSEIPTLWLATSDQPAPFGRVVKIEGGVYR